MLYRVGGGCLWLILGVGGAWALRESDGGAGGYALLAVVWLAGCAYIFRARVPREVPPPEQVNQGFAGWQGMANNALQLAAAETSKLLLAGGLLILLAAWWFGWRIIRREDPAQFVLLESKPAPQPAG